MKRYMVAAGVGSLVFAAAVGSASMLDVDAGVAQTGVGELGGDTNGVKIASYRVDSETGDSAGIRVTRINGVPQGSELYAVAFGTTGQVGKASTVYNGGNQATFSWNGPVNVENIESIRLTFESGD